VGDANTQRQGNGIAAIVKKSNSTAWKLISKAITIADNNLVFESLSVKKKFVINTVDI